MSDDQHALVVAQFGAKASAYVTSAVHASGPDLDWLESALREASDACVLDLGCGGGHVAYRVAPHVAQVVACDLSSDMIAAVAAEADRRGLTNLVTQQAPAEALPFVSGSFNHVLSRFSAHHWSDLAAGLREAARVLRSGGSVLLIDSLSPGIPLLDTHLQAIEALRDPSHVRNYSLAEWSTALVGTGLIPRTLHTQRLRMDFPTWTQRMRTPQEGVDAIRYLQSHLPAHARRHFAVEEDGSFMLDTLWIEAAKA